MKTWKSEQKNPSGKDWQSFELKCFLSKFKNNKILVDVIRAFLVLLPLF